MKMLTLIKIVCKTATLFFNSFISESETLINFGGAKLLHVHIERENFLQWQVFVKICTHTLNGGQGREFGEK